MGTRAKGVQERWRPLKKHTTFAFTFELNRESRAGLRPLEGAEQPRNADTQHDHISDFLNHAAVVSKILRPGGATTDDPRRPRGREPRQIVGIGDKDPILDRTLRDLLEHTDGQIDAWSAGRIDGNIDVNTGPVAAFSIGVRNAAEVSLRHYDDTTGLYYVLGQASDLRVIAASLRFVRQPAITQLPPFIAEAMSRSGQ
jgi:hypothetical protein